MNARPQVTMRLPEAAYRRLIVAILSMDVEFLPDDLHCRRVTRERLATCSAASETRSQGTGVASVTRSHRREHQRRHHNRFR